MLGILRSMQRNLCRMAPTVVVLWWHGSYCGLNMGTCVWWYCGEYFGGWWQLLWLWYMCVVAANPGIIVLAFTDI